MYLLSLDVWHYVYDLTGFLAISRLRKTLFLVCVKVGALRCIAAHSKCMNDGNSDTGYLSVWLVLNDTENILGGHVLAPLRDLSSACPSATTWCLKERTPLLCHIDLDFDTRGYCKLVHALQKWF